jgi:hypothetical protein
MKKTLTIIAMGILLPLCANGNDLSFGVKVSDSDPQGATTKGSIKWGTEVGGFAQYDLGNNHGLLANIDVSTNGIHDCNSNNTIENPKLCNKKILTTTVGINYTYHIKFRKQNSGTYLLAGVDVQKISFKGEQQTTATNIYKGHSTNAIGYKIGSGTNINKHIGTQLFYSVHNYKHAISMSDKKHNFRKKSLNLGLTYKF